MKKIIVLAADIIILSFSLVLALFLRFSGNNFGHHLSLHVQPFGIIFSFWILAFYIANLYEKQTWRNNREFYSGLLRAGLFATLLAITLFYMVPKFGITPRGNLALFTVIFLMLITATRGTFNSIFSKRFKKPVVIVGASEQSHELADFVAGNPQLGYYSREIIRPDATDTVSKLRDIISKKQADIVVISPEAYRMPELINLFYKSLEHRVQFKNLATFYEEVTGRVPLGAIDQAWFLENLTESTKRAYEMAKRVFDIALSVLLGLIFLCLLPILAAAIRVTSPGPVFYRQKRMGQKGKTFNIIKLRTMRADAESGSGAVWAQDNDPRTTPLGKFLRKSRIDEFPQLWNILSGEMSFVGPRAERPEFHERLKQGVPFYEERYLIKPGLSGWAQINYRYGASVADAAQKLQYDLFYIKHRSLTLDLGIILKTLNISVRQAGR